MEETHPIHLTGIHSIHITGIHSIHLTGIHSIHFTSIHSISLTGIHSIHFTSIHSIPLTGIHPIPLTVISSSLPYWNSNVQFVIYHIYIYSSVYCVPDRRKESGISFQSLTNLEIVVLTTRRNVNSAIVFLSFIFVFGFVLVSVHLYINRHNFFY